MPFRRRSRWRRTLSVFGLTECGAVLVLAMLMVSPRLKRRFVRVNPALCLWLIRHSENPKPLAFTMVGIDTIETPFHPQQTIDRPSNPHYAAQVAGCSLTS